MGGGDVLRGTKVFSSSTMSYIILCLKIGRIYFDCVSEA